MPELTVVPIALIVWHGELIRPPNMEHTDGHEHPISKGCRVIMEVRQGRGPARNLKGSTRPTEDVSECQVKLKGIGAGVGRGQ